MTSNVAHKISKENKQLYVDSKNNKKTKCIIIHTDLKNSEETAGIIHVEDKISGSRSLQVQVWYVYLLTENYLDLKTVI